MTNAKAALELALLGWPVMPVRPQAKEPLTRHGVKDATVEPARIRAWFRRWPDANLAIATGAPGPNVLDVDDPHAAGNLLTRLRSQHPPTVAAIRGPHLYYAGTAQATVTFEFGELRGQGSYILVPPSIHPTGKEYTWVDRPNGPLPVFPAQLLPHQRTAGTGDFDEPRELISYGNRHDALKDAAVRFLRGGFTDAHTLEQMLQLFFRARCVTDPPPRKDEFKKLAHWAATTDLAERERNAKPLLDPEPDTGKKPKPKSKLDKPPNSTAPLAEHRAYVHLAAGLPDAVNVNTVVRYGGRGINRLKIELSNGQQVIFDRQELVATRGQWARTVVMHTNGIANPANLTDWQALQALRSLCVLADAPPEIRENEDIDDHVNELEAMTEPFDHDLGEPHGRYGATAHCHARGGWEPRSNKEPDRPVLIVDKPSGKRYVRAGELLAYLNWRGFNIAPADLEARMRGIGLTRHVLLGREGQRLDGKRRRTNRMVVYELPAETE